ncbi:MAG: hypothetical protein PHY56_06410 [Candidatus Omnitrophica bacterium]|nr:hypothetical protein [Candidatus Omnitrophota bacterium]
MKNKMFLFLVVSIFAVLAMAVNVIIQPCFAAFSLSVTPYEGGYDLRFGQLDTQSAKAVKELTITITTDIGKQYRVYQRLDKSLATADGTEIERNQFKMYTLTGSNSKGTLEWIEEMPVMSSDTVLYTSNTAGEGDSFRVVYTLEPSASQAAGSYFGRFIFVLVPIDSTQDETYKTINIYADLTNEGAVEISTKAGMKSIRISSRDIERGATDNSTAQISVKGNIGARYNIYQQLSDSLIKASSSQLLGLNSILYKVTDANSGAVLKEGDLSDLKSKSLVYSSDNLGSAAEIIIEYQPSADFSRQKADVYNGTINYYMEMDRATAALESGFVDAVDIECEVEPVFKITATSIGDNGQAIHQEGVAFLQFGDVGYKDTTKESRINVKVDSNMARPYTITQKLSGPLQNEAGDKIPQGFFTFIMEKKDNAGGKLKFEDEAVIEPGSDKTIFVSNANGDSDEFDVVYKLKVTADTKGGNYNTGISYSLSEL